MSKRIRLFLTLMLAVVLVPATSQARYLNPNTGRFQTMDSYEGNNKDPLSLHKYTYCHANPVSNADPSGHNIIVATLVAGAVIGILGSLYIHNMNKATARAEMLGDAYAAPNEVRIWFGHNYEISRLVGRNGPPQSRLEPRPARSDDIFLACGGSGSGPGETLNRISTQEQWGGPPLIGSLSPSSFVRIWEPAVGLQGADTGRVRDFLKTAYGPDNDHSKWARSPLDIPASYFMDATVRAARRQALNVGATRIRFILLNGHRDFTGSLNLQTVGANDQITGQPINEQYLRSLR